MPKSKSDISNSALRIFLQRVGKYYDGLRGFDEFKPTLRQKQEILNFFNERCCYCNLKIDVSTMTVDHLIPMNKESLGLHAWGNGVPCCGDCNSNKHFKKWETYLEKICTPIQYARREVKIKAFLAKYKYEPNLELEIIATNLYQDVGAVAMTLIDLRFNQAEAVNKFRRHRSAALLADFAVGVLTPPLTKGNVVPFGIPYFSFGDPAAS